MTKATTLADIDARVRRIELRTNSIFLWTESIMTTLAELQTKIDELTAAGAEAQADAQRQTALVTQAVEALQGLSTAIADLKAQIANAIPVTQADLDALGAKADAALGDLAAANTARDAADAALADGVAAATPPQQP